MSKQELIGNVAVEKYEQGIDEDTSWEVIVRDSKTNKEIITYKNCKGGVFVIAQDKPEEDSYGGTRQGIFGDLAYILPCYFKSKKILGETLKKHLGEERFNEISKFDAYK